MTTSDSVTVADTLVCRLGEGPVWDAARQRLLWVDIHSGTVQVGRLRSGGRIDLIDRVAFDQPVGAVAVSEAGMWVVAGSHRVFAHPSERAPFGVRVIPEHQRRRTNDGKPDPAGRFVVGTLALDGESTSETLVRLDADGLTELDSDLSLSNGLAWTRDGATMYSIDTLRHNVYVRTYDAASGNTGPRRLFLHTAHDAFPDGMCLDAEEHLWIAMWGRGQVHRYTPAGQLDRVIDVPAPHVSSVAFAGPDLDTLIITTATQDLTTDQLRAFPLSGHLFTAAPGVRGLPVPFWNGQLPPERILHQ